jgi:hypothetical protein
MNRALANGGIGRDKIATATPAYVFFSEREENTDRLTGKFEHGAAPERITSRNSHA